MKSPARLLFSTALALSLAACLKNVSEADYSDSGIKERIETQLKAQKKVDLRYVTVDVHSSVVTLSGLVTSYEDRDAVAAIAKKTTGVEEVIVNLIVHE